MVHAVYRLMLCVIKLIEFFSSGKADTESTDWGMDSTRPIPDIHCSLEQPLTAPMNGSAKLQHIRDGYYVMVGGRPCRSWICDQLVKVGLDNYIIFKINIL